MLRILISGPTRKQAKIEALDLDFAQLEDGTLNQHNSGMPDEPGHAYLTVYGEDVNDVVAAIEPHGWRLRVHSTEIQSHITVMPIIEMTGVQRRFG